MAGRIQIQSGRLFRTELSTRMPFRYGIATVTHLTHVFVQLTVSINEQNWTGIAADHLAPKWFTKNPDALPSDEVAEILRVVKQAIHFAEGAEGETPFAVWRSVYDKQAAWGKAENLAPLLTNFGTSLVERALLDAFCKARSTPFAHLLKINALGIRWDEDGDFAIVGSEGAPLLPIAPRPRVSVRHTVGLSDPLRDAEIIDAMRLSDGLPQSLEACIKTYGLTHFKLKIGGDAQTDLNRLRQTVRVIAETVPPNASYGFSDWAFSLDGNESYRSVADFRAFWQAAQADAFLRPYLSADESEKIIEGGLLFVEQPLHRAIALSDEARAEFSAWPGRPPIIIDESDAEFSSFPRALEIGYAGTSHKNCKGVFKGIRNAAYAARLRRLHKVPVAGLLLSGEDLTNIGPIALPQDLAVQATLGIGSVERNGQHYFAGMRSFPQAVQEAALQANPDLYVRSPQGWPTLRIENGGLDLTSVNAAPFGTTARIAPETWAEEVAL